MKVLVIDDAAGFATAQRDGLQAEGHAADVAGNGVDCLWLARENPYDVIVLDVMLPGVNGGIHLLEADRLGRRVGGLPSASPPGPSFRDVRSARH